MIPVEPAPWLCVINSEKAARATCSKSHPFRFAYDVARGARIVHASLGELTYSGNGWWASPKFGDVFLPEPSSETVCLGRFGWVRSQKNGDELVIEDFELGRLKTSAEVWPRLYSELLEAPIAYLPGSHNPRYFVNLAQTNGPTAGWFIQ